MGALVTPELLDRVRREPMSSAQIVGRLPGQVLCTSELIKRVGHEMRDAGFQKMAVRGDGTHRMLWFPIDIDDAADDADRARLIAEAESELLRALRETVNALAMCVPTVGHAADCHHNAMTLGRAAIAKAEGRL